MDDCHPRFSFGCHCCCCWWWCWWCCCELCLCLHLSLWFCCAVLAGVDWSCFHFVSVSFYFVVFLSILLCFFLSLSFCLCCNCFLSLSLSLSSFLCVIGFAHSSPSSLLLPLLPILPLPHLPPLLPPQPFLPLILLSPPPLCAASERNCCGRSRRQNRRKCQRSRLVEFGHFATALAKSARGMLLCVSLSLSVCFLFFVVYHLLLVIDYCLLFVVCCARACAHRAQERTMREAAKNE